MAFSEINHHRSLLEGDSVATFFLRNSRNFSKKLVSP